MPNHSPVGAIHELPLRDFGSSTSFILILESHQRTQPQFEYLKMEERLLHGSRNHIFGLKIVFLRVVQFQYYAQW